MADLQLRTPVGIGLEPLVDEKQDLSTFDHHALTQQSNLLVLNRESKFPVRGVLG